MRKQYRCVTYSRAGFVQKLAVNYLTKGYRFWLGGTVPPGKDPAAVDRKLIAKYRINRSADQRRADKRRGLARLQYLRYERTWVILATEGEHAFFRPVAEGGESVRDGAGREGRIRNARTHPVKFAGYSVALREYRGRPKVSVRIDLKTYRAYKGYFVGGAWKKDPESLRRLFLGLPFEPYRPVLEQVFALFRAVNRRRAAGGLPALDWQECVRTRRNLVRPFEEPEMRGQEDVLSEDLLNTDS